MSAEGASAGMAKKMDDEQINEHIALRQKDNPLSAVNKYNGEQVVKSSFNPKTKEILYSLPGQHHADVISKDRVFADYVRLIYDPKNKVLGARVWGEANYDRNDSEADAKSFDAQYSAFEYFKRRNPGLRAVFNLTGGDLEWGFEIFNSDKIDKKRIVSEKRMVELFEHNKKSGQTLFF